MAHNSSSRDGCTCVACLCAALDPESAASSDAPLKDLLRAVRGMAADAVPPALREPTTLSTLLILAGAAESTLERLQGYNDAESGADAAARGTAPLHALLLLTHLVDLREDVAAALFVGDRVLFGAAPFVLAALLPTRTGRRSELAARLLGTLLTQHTRVANAVAARHADMLLPLLVDVALGEAASSAAAREWAWDALVGLLAACTGELEELVLERWTHVKRLLAAVAAAEPSRAAGESARTAAFILLFRGECGAVVHRWLTTFAAGRALVAAAAASEKFQHSNLGLLPPASAAQLAAHERPREAVATATSPAVRAQLQRWTPLLAAATAAAAAGKPNSHYALVRANVMARRQVLCCLCSEDLDRQLLKVASVGFETAVILHQPVFGQTRGLTMTRHLPELVAIVDVALPQQLWRTTWSTEAAPAALASSGSWRRRSSSSPRRCSLTSTLPMPFFRESCATMCACLRCRKALWALLSSRWSAKAARCRPLSPPPPRTWCGASSRLPRRASAWPTCACSRTLRPAPIHTRS